MPVQRSVRGSPGEGRVPSRFIRKMPLESRLLVAYGIARERGREQAARACVALTINNLMAVESFASNEQAARLARKHGFEDKAEEAARKVAQDHIGRAISVPDENYGKSFLEKAREIATEYGLDFTVLACESLMKKARDIEERSRVSIQQAAQVLGLNRLQAFRICKAAFAEFQNASHMIREYKARLLGLPKELQEARIDWAAHIIACHGIGHGRVWLSEQPFNLGKTEQEQAMLIAYDLCLRNPNLGFHSAASIADQGDLGYGKILPIEIAAFQDLVRTDPRLASDFPRKLWNHRFPDAILTWARDMPDAEKEAIVECWLRSGLSHFVLGIAEDLGWDEQFILKSMRLQRDAAHQEMYWEAEL